MWLYRVAVIVSYLTNELEVSEATMSTLTEQRTQFKKDKADCAIHSASRVTADATLSFVVYF